MAGKKKRESKTSNGTGRGAKPVHLTELQKILLVNGGALKRPLVPGRPRIK